MGLRMKNFNILGIHCNIWLLGGGGVHENQYRGEDCLKRGAWTVCRFKGGLGKKEGGLDTPVHTMHFHERSS